MTSNKLLLKSISKLSGERFYVPAYQRGYRWTQEDVTALLDDIWNFRSGSADAKKDVYYCLQPLVVSPSSQGWIIIDGQQRLTTILLIMTYLKMGMDYLGATKFEISYETRPGSQKFIENIDTVQSEENVDYAHMTRAFQAIDQWFTIKAGNSKINFLQTLMNSDDEGKNVKVIWYEVAETGTTPHVDIFTRLNIGKIRLTNAELIKAFLLQGSNFVREKANLMQIQIAAEWDYIEKTLQRDDFWYFIYDPLSHPDYENRIEYIFDRMFKRKKDDGFYHTFLCFTDNGNIVRNNSNKLDAGETWMKVKKYFQTLEEWYNEPDLYHFVGYLVCCGEKIDTLHKAAEGKTKKDFKSILHQKIKAAVNFSIEDLEYGRTNEQIRKVLLLFNIYSLVTSGAHSRYPFHLYKLEKWDIEHISSQTAKDIDKRHRKAWMTDIVAYFTGASIEDNLQKQETGHDPLSGLKQDDRQICETLMHLYCQDTVNDAAFTKIKKEVAIRFDEKDEEVSRYLNSIGNLALLDINTNRSYKNAFFPIKRQHIIKNDKTGKFVPICTKNVFLKYYSDKLGDVMHWKNSDVLSYTTAISDMLKDFLPTKNTI